MFRRSASSLDAVAAAAAAEIATGVRRGRGLFPLEDDNDGDRFHHVFAWKLHTHGSGKKKEMSGVEGKTVPQESRRRSI